MVALRRTKDGPAMIAVTRRNGTCFALNPDLIERVEATPDTVITLVGGARYVVVESVDEVVREVRDFRASVLAAAEHVHAGPGSRPGLHVVQDSDR
jgi:flagellar protein FlbD